jgi:DNA repair exonuclease SbcCD ATPase subunit
MAAQGPPRPPMGDLSAQSAAKMQEHKQTADELIGLAKGLQSTIEGINTIHANINMRFGQMLSKIEEELRQTEHMTADVAAMASSSADARKKLQEIEGVKKELEQANADMKSQQDELRRRADEALTEAERHKKLAEQVQGENKTLQDTNAALQDMHSQQIAHITTSIATLGMLKAELHTLESKVNSLKTSTVSGPMGMYIKFPYLIKARNMVLDFKNLQNMGQSATVNQISQYDNLTQRIVGSISGVITDSMVIEFLSVTTALLNLVTEKTLANLNTIQSALHQGASQGSSQFWGSYGNKIQQVKQAWNTPIQANAAPWGYAFSAMWLHDLATQAGKQNVGYDAKVRAALDVAAIN